MTWTFIQLVFSLICFAGAEYYVLIDGNMANEGTVFIYNGSTWSSDLCTDGWDDTDAAVMCRMLGYSGVGAIASIEANGSTFSSATQYKFDCNGTETSLQDCQTSANNQTICQNSSYAYLLCPEVPMQSDFFIMSFDVYITKMDRESRSLSLVQESLGEVRGIAFDSLLNNILWTDIQRDHIASSALNGGAITVIYKAGNDGNMYGITMDVNSRLIFYTDAGYDEIGFIDADTFVKTVVVNTNLDEPRAIVLDTQTREIFWTDRGKNAVIERANYDGSSRTTIVSTGLVGPNAMVLDGDRLIWCDAKNDNYEQAYRNGSGRAVFRTLIGSNCFDFILYEDYLYVNDLHYQMIVRVKTDGLQTSLYGPPLPQRFGIVHHIKEFEWC